MTRSWKISLYLLFFGILTILGAIFASPHENNYQKSEILGSQAQLSAFVEPDDGLAPVLSRIQAATEQILVEVYIISDPQIIAGLVAADRRGVDVKVILEEKPFGGNNLNQKSKKTLESGGVEAHWSRKAFRFTHEKAIIFDNQETCILNANLSTSAFTKNREFSICTQNPGEVKELQNIFWADWRNVSFLATEPNLVVSPINSRGKLVSLLQQAESHIEIVMEILDDEEIINVLKNKAQVMSIRVLVPSPEQILADRDGAEQIGRSGGWVRELKSPYLHAKLILVDGKRAYVGSVNLTQNSFDQNREVGIIVSQPEIVQRFLTIFDRDWQGATDYK